MRSFGGSLEVFKAGSKATVAYQIKPQVIVAAFLTIFFSASLTAVLQKSPTFDEIMHLYAGYSYLNWGDFRVDPEHPPLAKIFAALPPATVGANDAHITRRERDTVQSNHDHGWVLADRFLAANLPVEQFFLCPKLIMIGLAVLLGLVVFLWARHAYGTAAALVALGLYCLDPNIIAHSSLIHTDLPFALCFFAGTYCFWRTSNRVTWMNLLLTVLFFALSAITKFSFIVIFPMWTVLGLINTLSARPQESQITSPELLLQPRRKLVVLALVLAASTVAAYVAIWSAYGFRFDAVANQQGKMPIAQLISNEGWSRQLATLNSTYFVLPEAWVYGILDAFKLFVRPSYFLGAVSYQGSWLYFPVAFAVKTPLPTLLLLAVALTQLRRPLVRSTELFVLGPIVIFFLAAMWAGLNIGFRHILPIYPFLFVWLGGVVEKLWTNGNRARRWGVSLIAIWLFVSSLKIYPDYLTFFNELAGGPSNGHKILVDSNLDWGQDLKGLKGWMDEQGINKIQFAYFGTIDPAHYGINAIPLPGSMKFSWRGGRDNLPVSPFVAISATYLAGLYLNQKDTYASFRTKSPVADIGHSILIYRVNQ
jgi:hypothetical protein